MQAVQQEYTVSAIYNVHVSSTQQIATFEDISQLPLTIR